LRQVCPEVDCEAGRLIAAFDCSVFAMARVTWSAAAGAAQSSQDPADPFADTAGSDDDLLDLPNHEDLDPAPAAGISLTGAAAAAAAAASPTDAPHTAPFKTTVRFLPSRSNAAGDAGWIEAVVLQFSIDWLAQLPVSDGKGGSTTDGLRGRARAGFAAALHAGDRQLPDPPHAH
jgi:hypothetical protein